MKTFSNTLLAFEQRGHSCPGHRILLLGRNVKSSENIGAPILSELVAFESRYYVLTLL